MSAKIVSYGFLLSTGISARIDTGQHSDSDMESATANWVWSPLGRRVDDLWRWARFTPHCLWVSDRKKSMPKFVNRLDYHLTKATVSIFQLGLYWSTSWVVMVGCRKWQWRWMSMLTKNVIERPISVKHLTPPPFQGRRSRVAIGVEEATAAGISATLHMVVLVNSRTLVNFKTLQTSFSRQIINVDKCILQVGPGLRLAQFNKGMYWQVTFRWSDRCPQASCGRSAASCSFLRLSDRPKKWHTFGFEFPAQMHYSCNFELLTYCCH